MSASTDNADGNDEKIINWEEEATAIINDVKTHVAEIVISSTLPRSDSNIYLNIRTIEGENYCVNASAVGFRIVGRQYDTISTEQKAVNEEEEVFETPYALLDKISPRYVESFGNQLCKQLLHLQQSRTEFNEEDEDEWQDESKENGENAT